GTYTTGSALATAIVAALEAEDATPVWACAYNPTTHTFTLSADLAHTLLWSTGANATKSIGRDLGFDTSADDASATSHTADVASYQSRHALYFDLGSSQALEA